VSCQDSQAIADCGFRCIFEGAKLELLWRFLEMESRSFICLTLNIIFQLSSA